MAQHGTARHGTAQRSTVQHGTVQLSTARHSMARRGTAWCSMAVWRGVAQHGTAQLGMAWRSMAWHRTAWHSSAWHSSAWHGAAWHGTERHGMAQHTVHRGSCGRWDPPTLPAARPPHAPRKRSSPGRAPSAVHQSQGAAAPPRSLPQFPLQSSSAHCWAAGDLQRNAQAPPGLHPTRRERGSQQGVRPGGGSGCAGGAGGRSWR